MVCRTYGKNFVAIVLLQKDHINNQIFVIGVVQCNAPMKIWLLVCSFIACGLTLKIDVCKTLLGQVSEEMIKNDMRMV